MIDSPDNAIPPGLSDLPLRTRRELEVEKQREIQEGLTRAHVANATYRQRYLAMQLARVLAMGTRQG